MIKVVRNKVKEIAVEDLTDNHFIGVEFTSGSKKHAAVVKLEENKYISVSCTVPNSKYDSKIVYKSITELVTDFCIKECYVFESGKELFNWVANG